MIFPKYVKKAIDLIKFLEHEKPRNIVEFCKVTGHAQYHSEQIAMKLRRAGLIRSHRGPGGGYTIPDKVTLFEVYAAFDPRVVRPETPEEGDVASALNNIHVRSSNEHSSL